MAGLALLVSSGVLADMPPLAPGELAALAAVRDDGDVPDAAFGVLADHVKRQDVNGSDEPIRLRVVIANLLSSPAATRGELYRVEGQFLERRVMPAPYADIEEWFLRLPSGEPIAVYLPSDHATDMVADGRPVSIDARFYKVLEAVARDGQVHRYPAFFGASPRMLADNQAAALERMDILMLLGFLALLVMVALVVMAFARRQGRPRPRPGPAPVEDRGDMPDDPAAALRELRSRGERSQS